MTDLEDDIDVLRNLVRESQKKLSYLINLRDGTVGKDHKRIKLEPRITDHAFLRYLERACGVDVEGMKENILTPERREMILSGAKKIRFGNIILIIQNEAIVTVLR